MPKSQYAQNLSALASSETFSVTPAFVGISIDSQTIKQELSSRVALI